VVSVGKPIEFAVETNSDPMKIDHFWITIEAGRIGALRIALSTYSAKQAQAGFDPRMRVGIVALIWTELPNAGLFKCAGLDYRKIEASHPITYAEYERDALVQLLSEKTAARFL
jgi:hypothetical protein